MLLRARDSLLLVVDVQEKLAPHVDEHERVIEGCAWLLGVARAIGVPVLVSEHYPEGIGATVPALRALVGTGEVMRKDHFSCVAEPACRARIEAAGRGQIVIAGMEAHVCVMQTALDLAAAGRAVHVVADAISSRRPRDAEIALARMRGAGVVPVTREMVLFEWAERGATPLFRELHRGFLKE